VITSALTFNPLPSVFAALRRDRAEAKGEGGQERKSLSFVSGFADEPPGHPRRMNFQKRGERFTLSRGRGRMSPSENIEESKRLDRQPRGLNAIQQFNDSRFNRYFPNCGGRGAKILKEKPSAVTLPLVTEK
jgi:hypothetical protein